MKKFLLILFFGLFGYASYAQVGGIYYQQSTPTPNYQNSYPDPYSQPYQPQSSYQGQRSYQSQPQQRIIRTTAYSNEYNNYLKHPIKVIEYYEHGMTKYKIVEICQSTGFGVQWTKLNTPVPISECMPICSSNSLESQFTHKANVMGVIYYFDL